MSKLTRYRVLEDGIYEFHAFEKGQRFNESVWLEDNGQFEEREDGTNYQHYTKDFKVDYETIALIEADELKLKAKADKQAQLDTLVVESNTVPFDADNTSINYMSSATAIANFRMLQGMYGVAKANIGTEDETDLHLLIVGSYEAVYKTVLDWRNANNTVSQVQLETVAEALEQAMLQVGSIKTGE